MLSKTAEYALRAVVHLANCQSGSVSAEAISERTGTPRRYLHQVLQSLVAEGLVRSRSGPGGGYELARAPSKITILDVVQAVDPIERITACPLALKSHRQLCPLHRELDQAYATIEKALRRVTISKLVISNEPGTALCRTDG